MKDAYRLDGHPLYGKQPRFVRFNFSHLRIASVSCRFSGQQQEPQVRQELD